MGVQTIEVTGVPDDLIERLDERSRTDGMSRDEVVKQILGEALGGEAEERTFVEILKPIHDHTEKMGYTEDELDELFEEARDEVYRERLARKSANPG